MFEERVYLLTAYKSFFIQYFREDEPTLRELRKTTKGSKLLLPHEVA